MHVSDPIDSSEARIRAGDQEEKQIHVPVRIHTRSFHREVTDTSVMKKHSLNGFHVPANRSAFRQNV